MQTKSHISEAISNYYFQQQLPRTASLRNYPSLGKENMCIITNQSIVENQSRNMCRQPMRQAKISSPDNPICYPNSKNTNNYRSTRQLVFSNKLISQPTSLQRNSVKDKRSDSVSSQKKSVKFIEKPEDFQCLAPRILTSRSRSNSILKIRSLSKGPNKQALLSQLKQSTSPDYKNIGIMKRYKQIMNERREVKLRITSQNQMNSNPTKSIKTKYVDPCFPPLQQSLSKGNNFTRLAWRRLSEMKMPSVVRRQTNETSRMIVKYQKEECSELAIMLNLLKGCSNLLDFMFEDLKYNEKGAYIVKIFQENQWKYIIIDDFFPVEEKNSAFQLAYIKIQQNQRSQVWPLLLQKAYAAFLGSYDTLNQLSLPSLLNDLLRLPTHTFMADQKGVEDFFSLVLNQSDEEICLYGQRRLAINGRLAYKILKIQKTGQKIQFLQQNEDHQFRLIGINQLIENYKQITMVNIPNFQSFSSVDVSSAHNIGKQIKNKYFISSNSPNQVNYEESISKMTAKSFKITKMSHCAFIIKNYDRSQRKKSVNYWRVFLFQQELDSYRWIAGKYSNSIISFSCALEAGTYYLVLVPDWSQQAALNFCITSYGKTTPISFQSEPEVNIPNMIEKGCSDLAQRLGKMSQINKWICTYSLVYAEAGIIIQNVNNQRRNGSIKIFRTIKNLKTKKSILIPLNKEFYTPHSLKLKNQAQILIQKQGSTSIVLMLFGGLDPDFLKNFNFGL